MYDANALKESKKGRPVILKIRVEIGFMNDNAPSHYNGKLIFMCVLIERSDGRLVDFKRIRYLPQYEI